MGIKKQFGVKQKQKVKRRKKRAKLRERNLNPDDFYRGKFYISRFGK